MDINTIRSGVTLLSMLIFLAIVCWAWRANNRERFEQAANLPLLEE
jgi:cytochrome c oxidase cbb3-type subunit IV